MGFSHIVQKLLGRLCEQNRILKDQEAVVHRLRMEKVWHLFQSVCVCSMRNGIYSVDPSYKVVMQDLNKHDKDLLN